MSRHQSPAFPRRRFIFASSNASWGGSEELWSATAADLADKGHEVIAITVKAFDDEPRIRRLKAAGGKVLTLQQLLPINDQGKLRMLAPRLHPMVLRLRLMSLPKPDLVVLSQGTNFGSRQFANTCRRLGLPYVLVTQKAQDEVIAPDKLLEDLRRAYAHARWSYFVSQHNLRLTEEQIGRSLPAASVVRNPFLTSWTAPLSWPEGEGEIRLACVGRLYPFDKGQDILLRVLAQPKWKARPLSVTFFGDGPHRQVLEGMAEHLGLTSVRFAGFVNDVEAIWQNHHGLVLPSRGEGLPLVLVEAMLRGRVPIVTNVAGNGEVVTDNVTGFIASSPTTAAMDEAMERAWARRDEWRTVGEAGAASIRALVPQDPAGVFAEDLLALCADRAGARHPDT